MSSLQNPTQGWLALYMIPGLGNVVLKRLFERFKSIEAVFEADFFDLMSVTGLRREIAQKIVNRHFVAAAAEQIEKAKRSNAGILTFQDPAYPALLREVHNPPMVLWTKGRPIPPNKTLVALVGSRNPTLYGLRAAEKIAGGIAKRGAGVVSGLARGIDAAVHKGCLDQNGFTVGVLGTGIDVVYPKSNKSLYERILETGTIISEFPMGTAPEPRNFPIRNRIISGLCRGVAVIEAARKSGSLITAARALEQNREIFAVPGSIDSFKSAGTHWLIQQGAKLIQNADDILNELWFLKNGPEPVNSDDQISVQLDETEKKIFDIIGAYPTHIDQIARSVGMDSGQLAMVLLKMELSGTIRQLPGKMYVR